ncbi:DUF2867 domain-containing protein [Pyxidicoccus fallax]|uniref:DUF2867 domain-containing protein n=1 Tax=Pyxidicoccus fallax TaxID=394095 RepID=A0A848LQV4_9BACT|nr:DUF6463 family protein [Pyxidicoccus fallax]NMO19933.1 DUF2867 domain-containing protein [Pyxidicoccus fallax]NPC84298.1 DUF2867 domain-containing protein [Pyxidicoccus fallax]
MRVTNGSLLMVIGALHQGVGLVLYRELLLEMARAGVFNSVGGDTSARAAAFWFFMMGVGIILLGALARWVERDLNRPLPASFGWGLIAWALFNGIPMPDTGAWTLVPLGLRVLFQARKATALPEVLRPFAEGADHVDVKTVESEASLRAFIAGLMSYQPAWVTALYGVRAAFVRLLGMRQEGMPLPQHLRPEDVPMTPGSAASFFTVRHAEEEHAWVVAVEDKHLVATLAVVAEPNPAGGARRRFHVVTLVHYRNWAGPVYFNVIRPFHHVVVGGMARNAAAVLPTPRTV